MSGLSITNNDDGSLTVSETSQEGRRLTYVVAAEDAHRWLVDRGAQCGHRVKHTETEFRLIEIDSDDPALSEATHAEVRAVGVPVLTGLSEDRAVLKDLRDEFNTLWESRVVVASDATDYDTRNDRLDAIDDRMRVLRDELAVYEAAVSIAELAEHHHDEE
jgi:hypothetical protein